MKVEPEPNVHGGLTFASLCQEGAEDGPGICHIPEPGRPANVWWLGFDCGHFMDIQPSMIEEGFPYGPLPGYPEPQYRTFEYVQAEVTNLAAQIKAHV